MVVATMNLAEFEKTHKFFLNHQHALAPLGKDSSLTDHFCLESEKGKRWEVIDLKGFSA